MQLILDCFKRIFEALAGVYTKQETDAALAVKADATALEAEEQAREQADAVLISKDEEQEAFNVEMTAAVAEYVANPTVDLDWSVYGNCPYSEVAPTKPVVNFRVKKIGSNTTDTTTSFTHDLSVPVHVPNCTSCANAFRGNTGLRQVRLKFIVSTNLFQAFMSSNIEELDVEAPSFSRAQSICHSCKNLRKVRLVTQNNTLEPSYVFYVTPALEEVVLTASKNTEFSTNYAGWGASLKKLVFIGGLPNVLTLRLSSGLIDNTTLTHIGTTEANENLPIEFASDTIAEKCFLRFKKLNQSMSFPSLHTGDDMFLNAGMSAANISAVLDSLPSDPVGKGGTGVITFTGCPGAAELTQESPSVAAATARGWTVEL